MTQLHLTRRIDWRKALACISMLALFTLRTAQAQVIVVASPDYFKPYALMVESLLREAGFEPRIEHFPTERSFKMLVDGQVDMEFFRTQRGVESINNKVTLIGPVTCAELVAFKRIDSDVVVQKLEDLEKYRVAAQTGNKSATALVARHTDVTLPANTDNLFRMLDAGRFDIVIESERTGMSQISKLDLQGSIKRTGPVLAVEPAYLVLRNQNDAWGPRIKKAFAKRKASGSWSAQYSDVSATLGLPRDISQHCIGK